MFFARFVPDQRANIEIFTSYQRTPGNSYNFGLLVHMFEAISKLAVGDFNGAFAARKRASEP